MTKKKTSKTKKTSTKPKTEVDINDIDAMLEDMKNLAMEAPKEEPKEEIEIVSEKVEETSASIPKEEVTEITLPEAENKFAYVDMSLENEETDVDSEVVEETEEVEDIVQEETDETPIETEKKEEDLSFVDEIKEEETKKGVKQEQKPKPRKKITYQEMFGGTWRGYGYDSY